MEKPVPPDDENKRLDALHAEMELMWSNPDKYEELQRAEETKRDAEDRERRARFLAQQEADPKYWRRRYEGLVADVENKERVRQARAFGIGAFIVIVIVFVFVLVMLKSFGIG